MLRRARANGGLDETGVLKEHVPEYPKGMLSDGSLNLGRS